MVSQVSPKMGPEFLGTAWGLYFELSPARVRVEGAVAARVDAPGSQSILVLGAVGAGVCQTWVQVPALLLLAVWPWANDCLSESQLIFKTGT